jgi:CDP-diacylglycerol---serine O-phosphatidyltransferase
MDPLLPRLEYAERRRRRRVLFQHNKIPVRMLVPNFFTLLSLCAGLTAIRMAIELRYELAVALIVIAALLDGVDGRLARALRAQSRFGAELDSLADFVNFGVAPAVVVFIWGLGSVRGLGWISVLVFALAMGLRLARFNAMIGVENPEWQANYFSGMPAPAGAITVLLPLYIEGLGPFDVRSWPVLIACYTLGMAALLVSTIPTFSGKLLGERISRDHVLPAFVGAAALVALLVTYPYGTLTVLTLAYLLSIPFSYRRFELRLLEPASQAAQAVSAQGAQAAVESAGARVVGDEPRELPGAETKH